MRLNFDVNVYDDAMLGSVGNVFGKRPFIPTQPRMIILHIAGDIFQNQRSLPDHSQLRWPVQPSLCRVIAKSHPRRHANSFTSFNQQDMLNKLNGRFPEHNERVRFMDSATVEVLNR